jgi:hypothetical protein
VIKPELQLRRMASLYLAVTEIQVRRGSCTQEALGGGTAAGTEHHDGVVVGASVLLGSPLLFWF